jgi:hypothetical protein
MAGGTAVLGTLKLSKQSSSKERIKALREHCASMEILADGDIHKMASLHVQMILEYYQDVLEQAQRSFFWALVAAGVGTLFFIAAVAASFDTNSGFSAIPSVVAGALIQVISAFNFYLYNRASHQFASFHICLERTNRFLLANTMNDNLDDANKDAMRMELIRIVANAPMLTFAEVTNGPEQAAKAQAKS